LRKNEILNPAERRQLFGIPTDRDALARLYMFEPKDMDLIVQRRDDPNRLGFAVQLAVLRHLGMTLAQAQSSDITSPLPSEFLSFVSEQLGIPPSAMAGYASREQTMTDHSLELCRAFGLRNSTLVDLPFMTNVAAGVAASTDHALTIVGGIIGALRTAKIVLPTVATIERAALAGRAQARTIATQTLVSGLGEDDLAILDDLFIHDPDKRASTLAWLKEVPAAPKADHVTEILERLKFVKAIRNFAQSRSLLHPNRFAQFV